jgi:starch synthase (maltosyl-transferring)
LKFHNSDNPTVIAYSKTHGENAMLMIVNTDQHNVQWANITLNLSELGLDASQSYQLHDLLTDARYQWRGERGIVKLDPASTPAHVFAVRRHQRTENDFEYFI